MSRHFRFDLRPLPVLSVLEVISSRRPGEQALSERAKAFQTIWTSAIVCVLPWILIAAVLLNSSLPTAALAWIANGTPIWTAGSTFSPMIVRDGHGGAYIAWAS